MTRRFLPLLRRVRGRNSRISADHQGDVDEIQEIDRAGHFLELTHDDGHEQHHGRGGRGFEDRHQEFRRDVADHGVVEAEIKECGDAEDWHQHQQFPIIGQGFGPPFLQADEVGNPQGGAEQPTVHDDQKEFFDPAR